MEMLPEEKNLLEEIRATGVEIDDIEELMHMDENDKDLVPIVVKYIKRFEETNYRELLVRALGVKGFWKAVLTKQRQYTFAFKIVFLL